MNEPSICIPIKGLAIISAIVGPLRVVPIASIIFYVEA